MKRLLALSFMGSSLLIGLIPAKADWDIWSIDPISVEGSEVDVYGIYTYDSSTEQKTLRTTWNDLIGVNYTFSQYDSISNTFQIYGNKDEDGDEYVDKYVIRQYDLDTDQTTDICSRSASSSGTLCGTYLRNSIYKDSNGDMVIGDNSNINLSNISSNTSNISSNDTDISSNSSSISTNSTNISSNDTDISSNASNISSNDTDISSNASNISSNETDISALQGLISKKSGSTTTTRIGDSTKNTLEIGPTTNPTTIDQSGISVSGGNLIKKDSDGNIHIGKNSFVIGNDVLNGAHPIWAEDENGTKIPLNIYGSDLQINGVSVQGQISTNTSNISTNTSNIKNIGEGVAGSTALTAALSALPQTSKESKLSCGVGSGAYSNRYAVGFGCASKVNKRVDINAGGSYVFGGSKSYGSGTLDSGVVKAGFVFKLGALKKPSQISMEEKENFKNKIESLEEKNKQLLSRLERLEKIALSANSSKDLAIYKLK